MKILPVAVCVTVLLLSICEHSSVLGDEPDDDEIQIVNDTEIELDFDYRTGGRGWEEFEIESDDIWTIYCRDNARIRIRVDGRRIGYRLRCGNTYELYWDSDDGRIGVARVRD